MAEPDPTVSEEQDRMARVVKALRFVTNGGCTRLPKSKLRVVEATLRVLDGWEGRGRHLGEAGSWP